MENNMEQNNRKVNLFALILAAISIAALFMSIRGSYRLSTLQDDIKEYRKQAAISDKQYKVLSDSLKSLETRRMATDVVVKSYRDSFIHITTKYEQVHNNYIALPVNNRVLLFAAWLSEIDTAKRRQCSGHIGITDGCFVPE